MYSWCADKGLRLNEKAAHPSQALFDSLKRFTEVKVKKNLKRITEGKNEASRMYR